MWSDQPSTEESGEPSRVALVAVDGPPPPLDEAAVEDGARLKGG